MNYVYMIYADSMLLDVYYNLDKQVIEKMVEDMQLMYPPHVVIYYKRYNSNIKRELGHMCILNTNDEIHVSVVDLNGVFVNKGILNSIISNENIDDLGLSQEIKDTFYDYVKNKGFKLCLLNSKTYDDAVQRANEIFLNSEENEDEGRGNIN